MRQFGSGVARLGLTIRSAVAAGPGPPGRHLASGRTVRQDSGATAIFVACRGRGRRRARHPGAVAAQSVGGHTVLPQTLEKTGLRAAPADHGHAATRRRTAPCCHPRSTVLGRTKTPERRSRINRPVSASGRCEGSNQPPICNGSPRCTALSRICSRSAATCSGQLTTVSRGPARSVSGMP